MNIKLHIERIILDGLAVERGDQAALQAGIESELARLLVENGLADTLRSGGRLPSAPPSSFEMASETSAAEMGRQIAGAVNNSIGGRD